MKHDLVLVYPDISAGRFTAFRKHLGAGYLLAFLKERGIQGTFYCQSGSLRLARVAEEIIERSGRYVGFTGFDSNFYYVSLLARLIKQRAPHLTVLLGGPSATFSSDLILGCVPEVDACFKGIVEEPLARYIEAPECDKPRTPNLVWRDGDRIVHNPPLPADGGKHAADAFPSPYLTGVFGFEEAPRLGLLSSRGCFYHCTFCNFSAMANWRIQFHSPARVLAELEGVHERFKGQPGPKPHLIFYDDFFTAGKTRLAEICRGIVERGISRTLTFKCCTRADWVDLGVLEMLREAGVTKIVFGLESGSPEVLRRVKKLQPGRPQAADDCEPERAFLDKFRQSVREAKQVGLQVYSSIIIGLPGETVEQARGTIDFVESLGLDGYNHNFLQVFPGTELFEHAAEHGIQVQPSATVLPYLTYYTYDVTSVPVLALQGNIADARRQMADDLGRVFFPRRPRGDGDTFAHAYCEVQDLSTAADLWTWLADNVSPLTRLVFRQPGTADFRPEDIYPRLIDAAMPIVNYLSLYPSGEGDALCCEDVRRGTRSGSSVLGMAVAGQSAAGMVELWDRLLAGGEPEPVFHLAEIGGPEDLATIAALLARRAPEGRLPLTRAFLEQGMEVVNACQYGRTPCPASTAQGFPNAVLRADGLVRPCFSGPPAGGCDTCASELRRSFDRLFAARRLERDCDRCPHAAVCSRCPTLDCGPIRDGAVDPGVLPFLALVRNRQRVLELSRRFPAGRLELVLAPLAFRLSMERPGESPAPRDISFLPQCTLVLTDGESYYLFDLATGELYELNRVMVEVYESLACRVPGEEVIGYFTDTYELGRDEVSRSLDEAIGILQNLFQPRAEQAAAGAALQ